MLKAFRGKLLKINLTSKEITTESLNEEFASKFLGGAGYACRYLYDKLSRELDPLSPENLLMIMTGPLNGTFGLNTGRWVVCSKSPYTDIWGESNCGSWFGAELKKAGYDGIVIEGASPAPVYISISDNIVEIKDANGFWGMGTYESTKRLKKDFGNEKAMVACIGIAGENLVKYANIVSEERAAGRTGMGAIFGSKKLKAIIVKGNNINLDMHDKEAFKEANKKARETVRSSFGTQMLGQLGTSGGMDMYNATGELPIKYFSQPSWEGVYNISGVTMAETILTGQRFCHSCVIGCGRRIKISEGRYRTDGEIEGPEYETLVAWGSLFLNDNLGSISDINRLCFDFGIDTISSGSVISFLTRHCELGNINSKQLDGIEPKWGDTESAKLLLSKIVNRDGIGDVLAEGSVTSAKYFNIPSEEVAAVNNMEITFHDLRSNYGMSLAYGLGLKGPSHNLLDAYFVLLGVDLSEIGIKWVDKFSDSEDMAECCSKLMDYRALYGSIIMCSFCNPIPSQVAQLIHDATGLEFGLKEVELYGERIATLKRLFNLRMGLTPEQEMLPELLLRIFKEGGAAGKSPDYDKLKRLFYKYRGWDMKTGKPGKEKLSYLGLSDLEID